VSSPLSRRLVVALLSERQEFQRLQAEEARGWAARAQVPLDLVFADNNAIVQIQQVYRLIRAPADQRPAVILVQPASDDTIPKIARAAAEAGVGWVTLARRAAPYLSELHRAHPALAMAAVTVDHEEVGRIQGRQVRALIGSRGTVLYVQGPHESQSAQLRLHGARQSLAGLPIDLKVVEGDWMEAGGEWAVRTWLRLKTSDDVRLHLVACQNDAMAEGARRALQASPRRAEFNGIPLTGCDGLPDGGQRRVREGQLAATVVIPPNTIPALDAVLRFLRGGPRPPLELLLKPQSLPDEARLAGA
jgi:ribose transport system substrate-binding protein